MNNVSATSSTEFIQQHLADSHILRPLTMVLKQWLFQRKMNEVYTRYFTTQPPARSTVQAARLPRDVRVEIDVIALV